MTATLSVVPPIGDDWADYRRDFALYLRGEQKAKNTVRLYTGALDKLAEWARAHEVETPLAITRPICRSSSPSWGRAGSPRL